MSLAKQDKPDKTITLELHQNGSRVAKPRSPWLALIASIRPKQWTKNLLVFAPLLFTIDQRLNSFFLGRAFYAFVVFCLLSGATYLINDVVDVDSDRNHPTKQFRPIASGDLTPQWAIVSAVAIVAAAGLLSTQLGPLFRIAAGCYFLLTLSYSLFLKHIVLLDLLTLASGFVLRAVAGAFSIDVRISSWLILCTMLLALFLGIAKRRAELLAVLSGRKSGRGVIAEYSPELLDQMAMIVTSSLLMSYALYTIQSDAARHHHYLMGTIPFVLYGIFRYLYLVHKRNLGESPDEVLIKDIPLLANVVLWAITTCFIILQR